MKLESNSIHLREISLNDLDFVILLESLEENRQFIIPWSKEKHRNALHNKDMFYFIIEENATSLPVGYIILAGILSQNNSIELIRITISKKGNGYGRQAIELIKELSFNKLNAHRLWLDVKTTNSRAKHLYESSGFRLEGTLRECLKNGERYESLHVMSILKTDF